MESTKEVKDCPLCGGNGKHGEIPLSREKGTLKATCYMCLGTKVVPAWDYNRLKKMVKQEAVQIDMFSQQVVRAELP